MATDQKKPMDPYEKIIRLVSRIQSPDKHLDQSDIVLATDVRNETGTSYDFFEVIAFANPARISEDDVIKDIAKSLLDEHLQGL